MVNSPTVKWLCTVYSYLSPTDFLVICQVLGPEVEGPNIIAEHFKIILLDEYRDKVQC